MNEPDSYQHQCAAVGPPGHIQINRPLYTGLDPALSAMLIELERTRVAMEVCCLFVSLIEDSKGDAFL